MSPPQTRTRTATRTATRTGTTTDNATVFLQRLPAHAHWIARLPVVAIFVWHSFDKFGDIDGFATMMDLSTFTAFLVAYFELGAATLLLVGAFRTGFADVATRLGGLMIIPVMIGAIAKSHWFRWSFVPDADAGFPMGGMEFQVALIAVGLFFAMRGAAHARD